MEKTTTYEKKLLKKALTTMFVSFCESDNSDCIKHRSKIANAYEDILNIIEQKRV